HCRQAEGCCIGGVAPFSDPVTISALQHEHIFQMFSATGWLLGTIVNMVMTVGFHLPEAVSIWATEAWRERRTAPAGERWRTYFRDHDAPPTFLGLAAAVMLCGIAVWVIQAMHTS